MWAVCGVQVIDNEICFKSSLYHSVYELFHDRAMMHSKVCNVKICIASSCDGLLAPDMEAI